MDCRQSFVGSIDGIPSDAAACEAASGLPDPAESYNPTERG
jgi:hypothetical protein